MGDDVPRTNVSGRGCVFGEGEEDVEPMEWCDGPDAELESGVAFGGICSECYFERSRDTDMDRSGGDP